MMMTGLVAEGGEGAVVFGVEKQTHKNDRRKKKDNITIREKSKTFGINT